MGNLILRCDYSKNNQNRGFIRYSPRTQNRKLPVTNLTPGTVKIWKKLLEYLYFYSNEEIKLLITHRLTIVNISMIIEHDKKYLETAIVDHQLCSQFSD